MTAAEYRATLASPPTGAEALPGLRLALAYLEHTAHVDGARHVGSARQTLATAIDCAQRWPALPVRPWPGVGAP